MAAVWLLYILEKYFCCGFMYFSKIYYHNMSFHKLTQVLLMPQVNASNIQLLPIV